MKPALLAYVALMVLEGILAWTIGGQALLLAGSVSLLLLYAAVCQRFSAAAEGVRIAAIAVLGVLGPLYYQAHLTAVFLCLTALPHWLAATQAVWELRWGRDAAHELPRMRSAMFTIAFYASMALAFLLLRGMEPRVSREQSLLLALAVIAVAIPAWDGSRQRRMKSGQPGQDGASVRGRFMRILAVAGVLAALLAVFTGALPPAADLLCRISPRWQKVDLDFKNRPPHTPPTGQEGEETDGPARAPGGESFPITHRHELPKQANLQGTGDIRAFVKPDDPAQALQLIRRGPVYLRTHTLDRYRDGTWEATVLGGRWIEDEEDGERDGAIALAAASGQGIAYEVFLPGATGIAVPVLPGPERIELPRVFRVGDLLQASFEGNVRYRAVSAPLVWDAIDDRDSLVAAPTESGDPNIDDSSGLLSVELRRIGTDAFGDTRSLAGRVASLRDWLHQRYSYSLTIDNPANTDPLQNFLFSEKKGYCDFFATAATLILRNAGIPARMGYGYATGEFGADSGVFVFRQRNAHTWTEILVDGRGWVVCDFTPDVGIGNTGPQQERTQPEFDPAAFHIPQPEAAPDPEPEQPEIPSLYDRISSYLTGGRLMQYAMFWIPAAVAAIALAALLASWWKRRPERKEAAARKRAFSEKQPAYYREMIRIGADAGLPRGDGDTPREFLRTLVAGGLPETTLTPIVDYHYLVRYAGSPADPGREKSFLDALRELDRSLRERTAPATA